MEPAARALIEQMKPSAARPRVSHEAGSAIYRDLLLSLLPELVLTGWALVLLLFVAWRIAPRDTRLAGC